MALMNPADDQVTSRDPVLASVGDRCSNCDAPLASDQRYCVSCGQRRGKPRFSFETFAGQTASATFSPPSAAQRKGRAPSGPMVLVTFIGVLLLAMGVGVLIGHNGNGNSNPTAAASAKPVVVTVGGAGAAAAAPAASSSTGKTRHKGAGKSKSTTVHKVTVSKQTAAKAASAAAKVLGSGAPTDPTVQPGQKATGPGTQNGKFTGKFFP
jgi:hypothetical protein